MGGRYPHVLLIRDSNLARPGRKIEWGAGFRPTFFRPGVKKNSNTNVSRFPGGGVNSRKAGRVG